MKQFHLSDLFLAMAFLAVLQGGWFLHLQVPGFDGIISAMALLVLVIIVTVIAAAWIQNALLGLLTLVVFHVSVCLQDAIYSQAKWPDLLITTSLGFLVHAVLYVIPASATGKFS